MTCGNEWKKGELERSVFLSPSSFNDSQLKQVVKLPLQRVQFRLPEPRKRRMK